VYKVNFKVLGTKFVTKCCLSKASKRVTVK